MQLWAGHRDLGSHTLGTPHLWLFCSQLASLRHAVTAPRCLVYRSVQCLRSCHSLSRSWQGVGPASSAEGHWVNGENWDLKIVGLTCVLGIAGDQSQITGAPSFLHLVVTGRFPAQRCARPTEILSNQSMSFGIFLSCLT